jgi:hypothetical protein
LATRVTDVAFGRNLLKILTEFNVRDRFVIIA